MEVLTSDEARAISQKAIKPGMETFLQISADAAGRAHSLRLGALAATVRSAGAFKVVIDERSTR